MAKISILGVQIDDLSFADTVTKIAKIIESGQKGYVATANSEIISFAHRDTEYKQVLNQADIVTPDGAPVVWACRRRGSKLRERVTGIDLVWALAKLAEDRGLGVFLLGGPPAEGNELELAKLAARNLKLIHKNLNVVGATFGFLGDQGSEPETIRAIQAARPSLIFVAMSPPEQEKWIRRNLNQFPKGSVTIGIGGSFKMIAGEVQRAPEWMRRWGLEWLWRTIQEPRRISRLWNSLSFGARVLFSKR